MKKIFLFIIIIAFLSHKDSFAQINTVKCLAYAFYQNRDFKAAINLVEDSVKVKDCGAYTILGGSYLGLKNYSNALNYYLLANEIDAKRFNFQIAVCYAKLADQEKSFEYLKKSIQNTGRPLLLELSSITSLLNKYDLNTLYDAAAKQANEAKELIENNELNQALEVLDSQKKGNDKSLFYYFRAMVYFKNETLKDAKQDMKQAVKLNPELKESQLYKDICFATKDSTTYFNYILSRNTDYDLDLILEKINCLLSLKQDGNAQEFINQVQPICLRFDDYAKKLIALYTKNGDYLNALKAVNELIKQNNADYKLLNYRGKLFLSAKMYKEAMHDFSMSLDLCPTQAETYFNRGTARQALGEIIGSENDLKCAKNLGFFKQ